jgi:hypothetical protein
MIDEVILKTTQLRQVFMDKKEVDEAPFCHIRDLVKMLSTLKLYR